MLVVCGERRLADDHYTRHNLAREAGLASADTVDGDEVALRLVAADDASGAVPATALLATAQRLLRRPPVAPPTTVVVLPPLRAPPRAHAAA